MFQGGQSSKLTKTSKERTDPNKNSVKNATVINNRYRPSGSPQPHLTANKQFVKTESRSALASCRVAFNTIGTSSGAKTIRPYSGTGAKSKPTSHR